MMGSCSWCGCELEVDGLCQDCFDEWPNCSVVGCHNKQCLRFNSDKCYPHHFGLPPGTFTREKELENIA